MSYAQGQLFLDANDVLYACTTAGTPGTWAAVQTVTKTTTRSANATAAPGETSVCTAAITVTLPTSPPTGTVNTILATNATVTIARGGTNTITWGSSALASIGIAAGMTATLVYSGGVWYLTQTNGVAPSGRLSASAATSLPSGAQIQLALASTTFLRAGVVKTGNGLKVPIGGYYLVTATAGLVASSGNLSVFLYVNGVTLDQFSIPNNAGGVVAGLSDVYSVPANGLITVNVEQNSGGTVSTTGSAAQNFLAAAWLGP